MNSSLRTGVLVVLGFVVLAAAFLGGAFLLSHWGVPVAVTVVAAVAAMAGVFVGLTKWAGPAE